MKTLVTSIDIGAYPDPAGRELQHTQPWPLEALARIHVPASGPIPTWDTYWCCYEAARNDLNLEHVIVHIPGRGDVTWQQWTELGGQPPRVWRYASETTP